MSHATYSNAFYTNIFTSGLGSSARGTDNPCYDISLDAPVPSKYKRLQLVIKNQGSTEVTITFGDVNDNGFKLYAGQSVNFENYNGPFLVSDFTDVLVLESFA
jgi:hypothetical protein